MRKRNLPTATFQAITTEYFGPTDRRGARVIARAQCGKVVVCWDHALSVDDNHATAAMALVERMDWDGVWIGGALPSGTGNVYVRK